LQKFNINEDNFIQGTLKVEFIFILKERKSQWNENMRAVCKVCGHNFLILVGTLWRYGDGLFLKVAYFASDALLTTFHPLLKNALQSTDHFKISCLGAPFSRLEKPRNYMGQDLN
jgi:hypothetical protein